MEFILGYGRNVGGIAGFVGAYALFLGYVDESVAWFAANRELMVVALIVHFGLFALYWRMGADVRELRRRGGDRSNDDD